MNSQPTSKFPFFFAYTVHKTTIPIGIFDSDYERLAATYGVPLDTLMKEAAEITASNEKMQGPY